jgi:hypothetical protein
MLLFQPLLQDLISHEAFGAIYVTVVPLNFKPLTILIMSVQTMNVRQVLLFLSLLQDLISHEPFGAIYVTVVPLNFRPLTILIKTAQTMNVRQLYQLLITHPHNHLPLMRMIMKAVCLIISMDCIEYKKKLHVISIKDAVVGKIYI